MKRDKGSVSLEASMTFPFVLLALLALFLMLRYFVAYEVLQHAMSETGREMSSYYYFWASSGVEELQTGINKTADKGNRKISELISPFNKIQKNMYRIADAFGSAAQEPVYDYSGIDAFGLAGEVEDMYANTEEAMNQVERALENPAQMIQYLIQAAGGEMMQEGVNAGMNMISRALIRKHIPGRNLDAFLNAFGLESFESAAKWNHFSPETGKGSGDIELYVRYEFTVPLFKGYKLPMIQRAILKGWGTGV